MKHLRTYIAFLTAVILIVAVVPAPLPANAAGESINLEVNVGSIGQEITITGSGFDPGTPATRSVNVIFSTTQPSVIDYSNGIYEIVRTQILNTNGTFSTTFTVPEYLDDGSFHAVDQGTYYILITYHIPPSTNLQTVLTIASFNVLAGSITVTPETGPAGTEVTITGYDFGNAEELIIFYDSEMLTIFEGDRYTNAGGMFANTRIFIPSSTAGVHALTVKGSTSGHQAGRTFTVEPALVIKPSPGAASSTITVSGTGFGAGVNIDVTFNNISIYSGTTEYNGSFVSSLPPNTFPEGTYLVNALDSQGNADQISYEIFDASITMEPSTGSPGWEVNISGAGFKPDETITIGFEGLSSGSDISTRSDNEGNFSTVFTVPWGNMGTWEVDVSDGNSSKTVEFEVNTSGNIYPITNTSLPGNVGTEITVAGTQFIAGRTVSITYSGTQVATGTVESDGTFNIGFVAPSSSSGAHIIEATDGTNVIKYGFVMESSPPPKPLTLLPEPATKADAEAFFDWEDTADPSGVTYTLQIATDPSFSETYLILEEKGIIESEYTVPSQNKLNAVTVEAPYYWRVRAVDNAFNEGEWTEPSAFYVGFGMNLPQSVIYIIIVGFALLLAVFTFWLGRKTAYY